MTTETETKITTPTKTGRPTKLTPELQEKICKYLAAGNYLSVACRAVDIDDTTFNTWLKRGAFEQENGGGMYSDFLSMTKRAEAEAEAVRVARINAAGFGGQVIKRITREKRDGTTEIEESINAPQWLADITHLERRHRERWGRPAPIQVQVNETKQIYITHVEIGLSEASRQVGEIIEGEARELLSNGENRDEPTL